MGLCLKLSKINVYTTPLFLKHKSKGKPHHHCMKATHSNLSNIHLRSNEEATKGHSFEE